jgi:hypothetical protein
MMIEVPGRLVSGSGACVQGNPAISLLPLAAANEDPADVLFAMIPRSMSRSGV